MNTQEAYYSVLFHATKHLIQDANVNKDVSIQFRAIEIIAESRFESIDFWIDEVYRTYPNLLKVYTCAKCGLPVPFYLDSLNKFRCTYCGIGLIP